MTRRLTRRLARLRRLDWIEVLDPLAHFAYQPTALGRRAYRTTRWHHRIHLIPGRWLAWVCDEYDRQLGVYEP